MMPAETIGAEVVTGGTLVLVALLVPTYAYVVYPLVLRFLARPARPASASPEWPEITIILPVHNEESVIAGTIEALLAADYPGDRRHILVVSDASTDGTEAIVRGFADRGVRILPLPERRGKTAAENAAAAEVRTEIVVNTDASVRVHPAALKPLVAALADPAVGIASGRDVSVAAPGSTANVAESGYVGYEMWVRDLETRAGGIVGASGCFFASRRELQRDAVPEELSRDFAAPLIAREHGFRAVSVPGAVCFVPRASSLRREYRRKVRTMSRGLQTLSYKRHLLNPFRYGRFAFMLTSHKLVRWLVPWGVLAGVAGVLLLAIGLPGLRLLATAVVGLLAACAIAGWTYSGPRLPRIVAIPSYVVWGVAAGLHAWLTALRGRRTPIWEPTRRAFEGHAGRAGSG
jgi:cellulose synthase/poly-beta-1,6-N-acetylglucosamine synthase-like glycosyltransferase